MTYGNADDHDELTSADLPEWVCRECGREYPGELEQLKERLQKIDERIRDAKATDLYWPLVQWVQAEVRDALGLEPHDPLTPRFGPSSSR